MTIDLRYTVNGDKKTLLIASPNGTWEPIAMISEAITRGSPSAEVAWKEMLGDAIETAAAAAETA